MKLNLKAKMLLVAMSVATTVFGWTRIAITHARTAPRMEQHPLASALIGAPQPLAMTGSSR